MFDKKSQFQKDIEENMKILKNNYTLVRSNENMVTYADSRNSLLIFGNLGNSYSVEVYIDDFSARARSLGTSTEQLYIKMSTEGYADFGMYKDENGSIQAVDGHVYNNIMMTAQYALSLSETCDDYFNTLNMIG